ncbi:hypothetical protein CCP3SC1_110031 [Gammaproteobacteria bacterium]
MPRPDLFVAGKAFMSYRLHILLSDVKLITPEVSP